MSKPIIIFKDENNLKFTKNELEQLIESVYNQGYTDGVNSQLRQYSTIQTIPNVSKTQEPYPSSPIIWCSSDSSVKSIIN